MSEETKPVNKKDVFDPTRDGATSAVVSRALRRVRRPSKHAALPSLNSSVLFPCSPLKLCGGH